MFLDIHLPVRMCPGASDPFLVDFHSLFLSFRFVLLAPKDKDHYNPIMDLEKSLYTIIECKMMFP